MAQLLLTLYFLGDSRLSVPVSVFFLKLLSLLICNTVDRMSVEI